MSGEDDRVTGEFGQHRQAVVHLIGVASREVRATAPVEEESVTGDEPTIDEEALRTRRMSGGVHEGHVDRPDGHDIAGVVADQVVG